MKIRIRVHAILIFIFFSYTLKAQSLFKEKNYNCSQYWKKNVLTGISSEEKSDIFKEGNIIAIPYYKIKYQQRYSFFDSTLYSLFAIDSSNFFGVISKGKSIIGYVSQSNIGTSGLLVKLNSNQKRISLIDEKRIRMIEYASEQSTSLFFISFQNSQLNSYNTPTLGFFVENELKFIDTGLHIYNNFFEIINHKYGSLDKYSEIIADEYELNKISAEIFSNKELRVNKCKEYLRRDYQKIFDYCDGDTNRVINSFIAEADSLLNLNAFQNENIKNKLTDFLNKKVYCAKYLGAYDGVSFCGLDVSRYLKTVFTRQQFSEYLKKREMITQISSSAEKYLVDYYMNMLDAKKTAQNSNIIISIDYDKIKKKMKEDIFY